MPRAPKVWLTTEPQDDFARFARIRTLAARLVQRAQIVLQAAAGKADVEIAQTLDITRQTAGRLCALRSHPNPGGPLGPAGPDRLAGRRRQSRRRDRPDFGHHPSNGRILATAIPGSRDRRD